MKKLELIIAIFLWCSLACSADALVLEEYNYDNGVDGLKSNQYCCDHSVTRVKDPVRAGNYAMQFEQRCGDPIVSKGLRAEYSLDPEPVMSERWYGFSVFIPESWIENDGWTHLAQWHGTPDLDIGDVRRSSSVSLQYVNNKWIIFGRYDDQYISTSSKPDGGIILEYPALNDKNKWTDWVFQIKWDYRLSGDGSINAWKNGVQVLNHNGPIGYNDKQGSYFKWGVYRGESSCDIKTRVAYHDEIKVGDENSSLIEVSPNSSRADVNLSGKIDTTDGLLVLKKLFNFSMNKTNWRFSKTTGDVNCDEKVNVIDVLLIFKYCMGFDMDNTSWCH